MKISSAAGILRRTSISIWIGAQARAMRHLAGVAHRRSTLPQHLLTGERGELEAIFYLRRRGYTIVARRWRNAKLRGDIDLIAWDGQTLCFVEIKTRSQSAGVAAEAAVDRDKQETLRQLARSYIRRLPSATSGQAQLSARFDVLSLYLGQPETREHEAAESQKEPGKQSITPSRPYLAKAPGLRFVLYKGAFSWA